MIDDRYMAVGNWEISLRPDTPQDVLDGFSPLDRYVVVMPARIPVEDMADSLLDQALYTGVVTRFVKNRVAGWRIGGHSLAMLLGTDARLYGDQLGLPYYSNVAAGDTLDGWIDQLAAETRLTKGTVNDPTASYISTSAERWRSWRENLDTLAKVYDIEWRINPDATIDAGGYSDLWPDIEIVLTREKAGRENDGRVGLEVLLEVEEDWWSYASQVFLMSRGRVAKSSISGWSSYRAWDGDQLQVAAIVDGSDIATDDADFAASRLGALMGSAQREVTVSSNDYEISALSSTTVLRAGARCYVYDPGSDVWDSSLATQLEWRGEVIHPATFRCTGVSWPVTESMGVYERHKATTLGAASWRDLSDYVVPESGATQITIAADIAVGWNIHRGGLYKL